MSSTKAFEVTLTDRNTQEVLDVSYVVGSDLGEIMEQIEPLCNQTVHQVEVECVPLDQVDPNTTTITR
jgi:hypothetical protein